jgi:hypothetical protein
MPRKVETIGRVKLGSEVMSSGMAIKRTGDTSRKLSNSNRNSMKPEASLQAIEPREMR